MRLPATTFLLLLASAAVPAAGTAQGGPPPGARPGAPGGPPAITGRVTGVVLHAQNGQPLAGASVAIRGASDSALVGGGFANAEGAFRIDGLRAGLYTVRVRLIGYAPIVKAGVRVVPGGAPADVGRIELVPVAAELSAIAVTAERNDVVVAPDRTSYAVKDMPAASGGNAIEVLRHVPAIEVDGDNRVSLRGNESVVVQINGRTSPMRGEQLGNFLAQLPATMVARVEVVPNPSARNDPEGMAGIINIVLKENTDLGISGGANVGGGSTGQVNVSGNLGYQRGALTLFGNYGFMRDERTVTGFTDRAAHEEGLLPYLEGDVLGYNRPLSHSLNATADYRLGARDAVSSSLIVSRRSGERDQRNTYRELDADRVVTARYLRGNVTEDAQLMADWALTYRRTTARAGDGLTAELRANRFGGDAHVLLRSQALETGSGLPAGLPSLETNLTDEAQRTVFAQADWTRTVAARTKLETGYKATFRDMTNAFDVATSSDGGATYEADATRTNAFAYDERVHAVYGVLSQGLGAFDLQAGLRVEQANTRFDLETTGERYDSDYRSYYPSAIAAWNVDATRQLRASYSKRVRRPDTRQLNPFGFREDALNQFAGNPMLQPEYTHAYELGYQQSFAKGSLQLTPFARHTVNAVRMLRSVDDAGVLTTTFANVATSDSYGTDVNGSLRLGRVSGFGGVSLFQQVTDGSNLSTAVSSRALGWSARANATVKLTPLLDLQGFVMYRAPMTTEQGRMAAWSMTNLALRQKLRGDQTSVTLRLMDPFNTMGFGSATDDGRYYQTSERRFGARGAFLSFSHAFGRPPRISRPREPEMPVNDGTTGG